LQASFVVMAGQLT